MGISFASTIDPLNGRSTQALGQFFTVMLTLLFLSVDGHLVLVDTIVKSYDALPPAGPGWTRRNSVRSRCSAAMPSWRACCWRCRSASCCFA
ncbi:flagellar biosynthetic protein FliR [Sphingomonas sp. I4]